MMRLTYRPAMMQIEPPARWATHGGWIDAAMEMPSAAVDLRGLSVEVSVTVNGLIVTEDRWPRQGVRPRAITVDPSRVGQVVPLDARLHALWWPDDDVSLWARIGADDMERRGIGPVEQVFETVAPRPPAPRDQHGVPCDSPAFWDDADRRWRYPPPIDGRAQMWADAGDMEAGSIDAPPLPYA